MIPDSTHWQAALDSPLWIGIDIGGANLKVSDGRGRSISLPFPLWQRPNDLPQALIEVADDLAEASAGFAITMTGELADCYETKSDGVRAIVAAAVEAAGGRSVRIATTDSAWLSPQRAIDEPMRVAAANWCLAARLVAGHKPTGQGVWIDVGSTTTDITPIEEGNLAPLGLTDIDRLVQRELVYTGVRRTPVCAVVDRLPYRDKECPVAAEWFATTADAWLLVGELEEDATDRSTADGRPLTRRYSIDRLARCVCADRETFSADDAERAAKHLIDTQVNQVTKALAGRRIDWAVVGGEGAFLARRALAAAHPSADSEAVEKCVGLAAGQCLPAHAAAVLASIELADVG